MAFVVEMFAKAWTPEFSEFSCHGDTWEMLLSMAMANGWQPVGTVPYDSIKDSPDIEPPADVPRGNYKVKSYGETEGNAITAVDATAMADALERGKWELEKAGSPFFSPGTLLIGDEMNLKQFQQINSAITPEYLDRFISFLRKGGFGFAWDD